MLKCCCRARHHRLLREHRSRVPEVRLSSRGAIAVAAGLGPVTSGTTTRCSSASEASGAVSGAVNHNGVVLNILVRSRRGNAPLQAPTWKPAVSAACPDSGQADQIRHNGTRDAAGRRTSPEPLPEQPSGELATADPTASAMDAAVHVDAPGPAFPIRSSLHLWPVSPSAPSHDSQPALCQACEGLLDPDTGTGAQSVR